jgi:iron complex outermembrane receptor protein
MQLRSLLCASAATWAALAGTALAQEGVRSAGGGEVGLSEIVVTAMRRETLLQETPIAVTALGRNILEKERVVTIADATRLVPSFAATTEGDHGVITLTMRGIGNDSAKTEYADPEVALFVDGIYSPRAEGASAMLFDLDSVEVLRGPQGTLWGRNSTAGAVNMQTAKPKLDGLFGTLTVGGGNFGRLRVRGAVNVPLTDTLALRFAAAHEEHDGYVSYQSPTGQIPSLAAQRTAFLAAGGAAADFRAIDPNLFIQQGQRYGAQDQSAVRVSALWRPTEQLQWNLSYEYFADRGSLNANLMQTPRPGQKFWSILADTPGYVHRDVNTIRSRIDYQFNPDIAFSYIAGYSHFTGESDFDQDGGAHVPRWFADPSTTHQEDRTTSSRYESYSHEVQVHSSGKQTVDWILGLYYQAEDNRIRFDIPIFNGTEIGTVGWQGSFIQPKETVRSEAAFGQATWNISDRFRLTGGLRYTNDHRANKGGTNNAWAFNPACPQAPLDPGTNPLSPAENPSCFTTYQHNDASYKSDKVTWLARAEGDLAQGLMAYASVSTGYKSGGTQDGGLFYKPETLTNYEAGVKLTFLGGRATWNNALYYEDFKNFQQAAPVTFSDGSHGLAFSNLGGKTKVTGFESELSIRPTDDDVLQAFVAFLHTKAGSGLLGSNDYGNLPSPCPDARIGACVDVTGHTLPHAPDFATTVAYEHDFHLPNGATLTPRASVHYETSSWLSLLHDGAGDKQGSWHRTDLNLEYRPAGDHPWALSAWVQNLEDKKVRTNAGATGDNIYTSQYQPPRTFGVDLKVDF